MFPALMYYGASLPFLFPEYHMEMESFDNDQIMIIFSLNLQVCNEKLPIC